MTASGYLCPRPDPGPDTAEHWRGLQGGRFLVQRCLRCGRKRHYPRPVCDACHSLEVEWVPIEGRGRIVSWTVCRHAFLPEFREQLPYIVAIAEVEDGLRVNLRLEAPIDAPLQHGDPVRIDFRQVDDGFTLAVLVPRAAEPRP